MARVGDEDLAIQIKSCFKQFDVNGDGVISHFELREVLERIAVGQDLPRQDIERCITMADANHDGQIEYEEFVNWLMMPGCRVQASNDGASVTLNLEVTLKPLFQVFDRNGDGILSYQEFEECFCILQNAMKMSKKGRDQAPDPELFMKSDAAEVFGRVDNDGNEEITFREFVQWQRKAFEKNGLLSADLKDLVPALARQLERVFKFSAAEDTGSLTEVDGVDTIVLKRVIDNLATFARSVWNEKKASHNALHGKLHYPNRWSDPPVGLNIERLIRHHLMNSTFQLTKAHEDQDSVVHVICVPELDRGGPAGESGKTRKWVARLCVGPFSRRRSAGKLPRDTSENFSYYVFQDLSWDEDSGAADLFNTALDSLSPDMRFFCLLKTQSNFGTTILWNNTETAMKDGVTLGLLTEEQHQNFNGWVVKQLRQAMRGDNKRNGIQLTSQEMDSRVQQTLQTHHFLCLRSIMAALLEMSVFEVSSKLADCINT